MSPQPGTYGLLAPVTPGLGFADLITIPNPGANANASYTVPGENSIRILGATATLTTDATVANRFVALDYIWRGTTTVIRNGAGLVVVASTTNLVFSWNYERTGAEFAANTPVLCPCALIDIPPGAIVQVTVDNKQAGDTLTAISLWVERFETGDRGYARGVAMGDLDGDGY